MSRRTLVDGLSETPQVEALEKQFVYGEEIEAPVAEKASEPQKVMAQFKGRVPLTTRCRPELASALKRASLERQLSGAEPNRMQDIFEQAIEDWLSTHGYSV